MYSDEDSWKPGDDDRRKKVYIQGGVSWADIVSIASSIITAVCIGGPLLVWGGKMDARVGKLEEEDKRLELQMFQRGQKSDADREILKNEVSQSLRDINSKLDRLIERGNDNR